MLAKPTRAAAAALPSDLKYINRRQVLEVFRNGGAYTVADVSRLTSISRQTVSKSLTFFESRGLLVCIGKGKSTEIGGKRPELYTFSCPKYMLGITLWPGTLNLTLMDMQRNVIDRMQYPVNLPHDVGGAFDYVGVRIDNLLLSNRVEKTMLYGAALSTAGTVDYATNRLKYTSITPEWGADIPVEDYLRPHLGQNTMLFVENAGKMTGRAIRLDAAMRDKRVLSLFTTWGFSACFIYNGHVLSGTNSLIGEVGHMTVDCNDDEPCGCGSRGCLERLVSIDRVRRIIAQRAADYPDSPLLVIPRADVRLDDVFRFSERGDALARAISDYLTRLIALALRNVSLSFDPDVVVFQGDYAGADAHFDLSLKKNLAAFQYYPAKGPFEIRYDRRPLIELDVLGASATLQDLFFDDAAVYEER